MSQNSPTYTKRCNLHAIMELIRTFSTARSSTRLTKENIKWLEQLFRQYAVDGDEIRREDFKRIIQTKNPFFTDRVFDIFDKDSSGTISLHEFMDSMRQFGSRKSNDKIRFLFRVYDVDGDGLIQKDELAKVIRACMEENGLKFSDDQIAELTMVLFEDADVDKRGALTYDAFKTHLEKHKGLLENLSITTESWLTPPKPKKPPSLMDKLNASIPHQFSSYYIKNNYVYLTWLLVFLVTNLTLFITRYVEIRQYAVENNVQVTPFLLLAKGCGQCLNFNASFIVVAMLRQCLTFLRARGAGFFLPIDEHIHFHKMMGCFIFFFGMFHTIMHLFNIKFGLMTHNPEAEWSYFAYLFNPKSSEVYGLVPGYAFNTGVVLVLILTSMVVCSLPFVRRGGSFEVFYWTHLLYVVFFILLIIHAPNFWKWFLVPGIAFLIEQVLRVYHWRMGRGKTCVTSGILLPSKVTHLVIRRPPNFDFHPGDYVFIRIPHIAKYEWHPFTISSAPEQEKALWLHIRAVGEWTTRLHEYFQSEQQKLNSINSQNNNNPETVSEESGQNRKSTHSKGFSRHDSNLTKSFRYLRDKPTIIDLKTPSQETETYLKFSKSVDADVEAEEGRGEMERMVKESESKSTEKSSLEVYVDGPYGAPSSHIFGAEHAVLIGTGIGVTPFASILQSIMRRYWASKHCCPNCDFTWCSQLPQSVLKLRKVDFFWINRDQRSFEWFVQLLSQLEIEQAELGGAMERFLDMHMYITSALQKTDMKAVGLQLALDLLHEKEKRDLITGLKTRTNAGRPNWDKIFTQLTDQRKGKITVFYCGPPALARTLKVKCDEFGFSFKKELF